MGSKIGHFGLILLHLGVPVLDPYFTGFGVLAILGPTRQKGSKPVLEGSDSSYYTYGGQVWTGPDRYVWTFLTVFDI